MVLSPLPPTPKIDGIGVDTASDSGLGIGTVVSAACVPNIGIITSVTCEWGEEAPPRIGQLISGVVDGLIGDPCSTETPVGGHLRLMSTLDPHPRGEGQDPHW